LNKIEGSPPAGLPRIFALLRIVGEQAVVFVSNDATLRERTMPWKREGNVLPASVLQALRLNIAVHQSLRVHDEEWVLVCGARGAGALALPEPLDDWSLELIEQLVIRGVPASPGNREPPYSRITTSDDTEQRPPPNNAFDRAKKTTQGFSKQQLILCAQPIFDVVSRRATHVEVYARYRSDDQTLLLWPEFANPQNPAACTETDQWALEQALERAQQWTQRYAIRAIHVNVTLHDESVRNTLLQRITAAPQYARETLAIEIGGVTDFATNGFIAMAQTFARAGVAVGVELCDYTLPQLVQLRRLPISFVKVTADEAALGLGDTLPWDIFITRVQANPAWRLLQSAGVKFVQGYALAPPVTAPDFERWIQVRVTPPALAV
jgi:EAL domain-containing protein (putative c-di-GMP-specific phosphodiesterase class I)